MGAREVISAIESRLKTIPDVGNVYPYTRWAMNWKDVFRLMLHKRAGSPPAEEQIFLGWMLTRTSSSRVAMDGAPVAVSGRRDAILIRGYMSQKDSLESEREWQDRVDTVLDLFDPPSHQLHLYLDDLETIQLDAPPEAVVIETRAFGEILSHYCEIRLDVIEELGVCGS